MQETSTFVLGKCLLVKNRNTKFCNNESYKEIIQVLIRRTILPLYIPVITLICCMLLEKNNNFFLNKTLIFVYSFILLVITELLIRYTGLNSYIRYFYIFLPFCLFVFVYIFLVHQFSREVK